MEGGPDRSALDRQGDVAGPETPRSDRTRDPLVVPEDPERLDSSPRQPVSGFFRTRGRYARWTNPLKKCGSQRRSSQGCAPGWNWFGAVRGI